jgi:hypothetical protein
MTPPQPAPRQLAFEITRGFTDASFDLSLRPGADPPGWEQLPESTFAAALAAAQETPSYIRAGLTLVAAMDRARDAMELWSRAANLQATHRWVFLPHEVATRSFTELSDVLRTAGVSQRHLPDAAAWRRIAEALVEEPASPVARIVGDGVGDAVELLSYLTTAHSAGGSERFPYLSGPKVGPMWVRMMAYPGGGHVARMSTIPVAVDVQVRRVTENLGVTDTRGRPLEEVRDTIQDAWFRRVAGDGADGPGALAGTCAALDPALWYFGRVGCSRCEDARARIPMAAVCADCRLMAPAAANLSKGLASTSSAAQQPLIGLVGCVKEKLTHAAPAKDLYTSPLFIDRRRDVEGRASRWFILSAKHGLVDPEQVLEPYDRTLSSLPIASRRGWSRDVLGGLRQQLGDLRHYKFEIHAGHSYFGHGLLDGLRSAGAVVSIPTEGLSLGRQLQYYRAPDTASVTATAGRGARQASPYQELVGLLDAALDATVTLSLAQIEEVVRRPLPPSARIYSAWWSGSSASRIWRDAGWNAHPRVKDGLVRFTRTPP